MNQQTCIPERLDAFLQNELSDFDEQQLTQHLDECAECRDELESRAAEQAEWQEASRLLGGPNQQSASVIGDHRTATVCSPQIQQILQQLAPTDDPASLGRIGGYEVTGVVGAGGMGVVLKAHDRSLDRIVAIKVMSPHLASSGSARQRFAREAKAAAAVLHPNVIAIHSVASEDGSPFLVMPYVRGASLQKRIDSQGPLPLKDTLRMGSQIAAGLAAAHEQGLVHRDIKPANILLEEGVERVTITDFGLARAVDDASMTCSGVIAGTPQYMSPEQTRGEPIDARSDLFSLGSVLYAMCAGRSPFRAETTYGVLHRIANDNPTPICEVNSDVPVWLGHIIERLMAKRPDDRFESAAQVAELLEGCLAHVQQPAVLPLPESVAVLEPRKMRRPPIGKYIAATVFLCSILFASVLIVLESNKGTLTIECEADDVSIRIKQGEHTVEKLTVQKNGTTTRLKAGEYIIEIDEPGNELEVANNRISISRGANNVVNIVYSSNRSKEKANVAFETEAQAGVEKWLPTDTTGKIIVELYGGRDVLGQMNTSGPNKVKHVKLFQELNAIESVVVNFRESGPGNEIALVIVRDPSGLLNQDVLTTGKTSARRDAISKALGQISSVRWEEGWQATIKSLQGVWNFISVESDGVVTEYKTLTTQLTVASDMWMVNAGLSSGGHRVKIDGDKLTFYGMTTSMRGIGASIDVPTIGYGRFKLDGDSLVYLMTPASAGSDANGQNEPPIQFPESFETKGTQNNVFRLRRARANKSAAGDFNSSSKVPKEVNPLEARTLDDVTAVYNEQTRQLRAELFNPLIPDLATDQMRAAMLDAAQQHRKLGKVEIALALEDSVELSRLDDRLTFMGSLGTAPASFRQITPQFHFQIATNALDGFPLRKAELRYSQNGWSSKAWGDIHPPITGKWNLVAVEESGETLTDDAFKEWRQKHAGWTQLAIDEKSLTMTGDKAMRFDFSVDHDAGVLPQYTISQDGDTKFAGVLMGNGFVDDTTLVCAVDLEGRSTPKTFHTKDGKTTNLTYCRDEEAEIQATAPLKTEALNGTVEPAATQSTEEILNTLQGHPKATDRTRKAFESAAEAARKDEKTLNSLYLLAALLRDGSAPAINEVADQKNVSMQDLIQHCEDAARVVDRMFKATPDGGAAIPQNTSAEQWRELFANAEFTAKQWKDDYFGTEHLLMALIADGTVTKRFLKDQGIDAADVRDMQIRIHFSPGREAPILPLPRQ